MMLCAPSFLNIAGKEYVEIVVPMQYTSGKEARMRREQKNG